MILCLNAQQSKRSCTLHDCGRKAFNKFYWATVATFCMFSETKEDSSSSDDDGQLTSRRTRSEKIKAQATFEYVLSGLELESGTAKVPHVIL